MALMNYPAASHGVSEFFQVIEHGYLQQELRLAPDELAKALKGIIKREFPRSRKVRIYNLAGAEDFDRQRKKL